MNILKVSIKDQEQYRIHGVIEQPYIDRKKVPKMVNLEITCLEKHYHCL